MDFLNTIKAKAKLAQRHILLPESDDVRVLQAANEVIKQGIAQITLIGEAQEVQEKAAAHGIDVTKFHFISPTAFPKTGYYRETLYALRKHKLVTLEQAAELIKNPLYFGTMMVYCGDADGMVAGSLSATGDVLRPALQILKTKPGYNSVSGAFLIAVPNSVLGSNGLFVFADCAVNVSPDSRTLAEIGMQSAETAQQLAGFTPVVSFLSFSTKGSAKHELVDKVSAAVRLARAGAPNLALDGEFQADAALIEAVGQLKAPGSPVAGKANVLVFPDLQSGNIGYKLVERLANATAIGPILQGLAKPVNDLSRGCGVADIVNMVAITAVQAGAETSAGE